jgi:hypothetical protein
MTEEDDRHSRLVAAFLAGLSKEGIDRQCRHEFRQGYPKATEAEIWLLFNADRKNGSPPWSLRHAREIMARDNVWACALIAARRSAARPITGALHIRPLP